MKKEKTIKVKDYVKRISYNKDICFKVTDIIEKNGKKVAKLKGINVRLLADCSIDDLVVLEPQELLKERHENISLNRKCLQKIADDRIKRQRYIRTNDSHLYFELPGKVLHIDGDEDYMHKCLNAYNMLDVPVVGKHIAEENIPHEVVDLIKEYKPDILVITGHDAIAKGSDIKSLESYRTSKYFIDAIKNARSLEPSRDALVIIAGACQSFYEALIDAGANFATSPKRILVHAFDPVYIAEKIAFTSIYEKVNIEEALGNTITGKDGIGGVDTWGHYRIGYPKSNP